MTVRAQKAGRSGAFLRVSDGIRTATAGTTTGHAALAGSLAFSKDPGPAVSLCCELAVGVCSDPGVVPDLGGLAAAMDEALAELRADAA
jgi:hypothetical protein